MSARADTGGEQGGIRHGAAFVLAEVDPTTLPEDPRAAWEEARRRYHAYKAGRDGWRTGALETTLDTFVDEEEL
ncbi:hypothetical protein [Halorubrum ezzemoulense]|uniref:Uncharacterized protein n=1 Tax=Halorubrum ezzemoulense TaxID=337243 RepID=A0A256JXU3_HALEZ|nr:hypothetical protein [Halorubrum ezzemoulense]OYR73192.1 hypothetical protein DJ76_10345 [Halorubrum ezzemoulense]